MKKVMFAAVFLVALVTMMTTVQADSFCNLDVTLLNQDPYPAQPGDYVDVVFQVTGVNNRDCGEIKVTLIEDYPFTLDPGVSATRTIMGGTTVPRYSSFFMAPFRLRVDENAIDETTTLAIRTSAKGVGNTTFKDFEFDIEVEDAIADFEVYVSDYSKAEKSFSLEVLNIADTDVEAIVVEIPQQENIFFEGANYNIIGDLDANEYTTADFDATAQDATFMVKISYSDATGVRRSLEKQVVFNSALFPQEAEKKTPWTTYIGVVIVLAIIVWWFFFRKKKKKKRM